MFDLLGFLALTIDINTWYCCVLSMGSENCWRPEVSTSSPASSVMSCLNKTTFFFLNFLQACLGCGETDLEGSDSGSEEYYSSCSVSSLPWDLIGVDIPWGPFKENPAVKHWFLTSPSPCSSLAGASLSVSSSSSIRGPSSILRGSTSVRIKRILFFL